MSRGSPTFTERSRAMPTAGTLDLQAHRLHCTIVSIERIDRGAPIPSSNVFAARASAVSRTATPPREARGGPGGAERTSKMSATKTVIVTGASQGIGAGLVKAFLERGYQVVA